MVDLCSPFRILNHFKLKWIEKGSILSRELFIDQIFLSFFLRGGDRKEPRVGVVLGACGADGS